MGTKNNSKLFYTCSLIEFVGRKMKRTRREVVDFFGNDVLERIYEYSDIFHCEPIEKVAAEFLEEVHMTEGKPHHFFEDLHGICRGLGQAQAKNTVHSLCMTFAAHIMTVDTAGLAHFLFMTNGTLHQLIPDQILKRCFADQTFFLHQMFPLSPF